MSAQYRRLHRLRAALAPSPVPLPFGFAGASSSSAADYSPMPPHGRIASFTGGGGCTAEGLVRECSMLKVRTPALIAGYNEWHRKVWPELQSQIFLAGVTNYSIFQRPDGLLFLYMESNPVLAQQHSISSTEVSTRWEELMDPFLDPGFEYNGPLEHVMYMDPDPSTRSMQPIPRRGYAALVPSRRRVV